MIVLRTRGARHASVAFGSLLLEGSLVRRPRSGGDEPGISRDDPLHRAASFLLALARLLRRGLLDLFDLLFVFDDDGDFGTVFLDDGLGDGLGLAKTATRLGGEGAEDVAAGALAGVIGLAFAPKE